MKRLLLLSVILLCIPFVFSIPYKDAVKAGEDFIRNNAAVGHKGVSITDYRIEMKAVYQNELSYRIYYLISADAFGIRKERAVMLEIDKESGIIKKAYLSKEKETDISFL